MVYPAENKCRRSGKTFLSFPLIIPYSAIFNFFPPSLSLQEAAEPFF